MNFRMLCLVLAGLWCASAGAKGQVSIFWNSAANAVNKVSDGQVMDAGFRFELGVFTGSFVPTVGNKNEWAAHWIAAQRTAYNAGQKSFADSFNATDNDGEFAIGKEAYVWGFRGTPSSGEWILFRSALWQWPDAYPFFPMPPLQWYAENATAILGEIDSDGFPFLMKSAAVANAAPPTTTWDQWKLELLTGEALDDPDDDPDLDGSSNLLEFVFGTDPKTSNAPVSTSVALVSGHAVITIPRRIDHLALLTVEVSGNLVDWNSGPLHTEIVADDASALIVRDLTPLGPANPKRFMRLKAAMP